MDSRSCNYFALLPGGNILSKRAILAEIGFCGLVSTV
jgi:hypothetical protein